MSILQQVKEFLEKEEDTENSLGLISSNSRQYECRVHKIKWDDEVCCMLTLKDVTSILTLERIKAENDAKNSIIRSISHEFRTPINCINLIIDQIFPRLEKEFQEKMNIVKINTKLLIFQLNDILDFSEISSGKFRLFKSEVDIKEELKCCTELIKYQGVRVLGC